MDDIAVVLRLIGEKVSEVKDQAGMTGSGIALRGFGLGLYWELSGPEWVTDRARDKINAG